MTLPKARSALLSAGTPQDKIAANQQLDGALGRLLLIVENYPQLKSNENFLRLQDELAGTENRIAVERKRYNDTLQDYNTYVQKFPNNIYAGWAGFKPNEAYFAATEAVPSGSQSEFLSFGRAPASVATACTREVACRLDFAVELGPDDETLEIPWAAEPGGPHYYDLKRHPEHLANIEEARRVTELGEFLAAANSPASIIETAKCDAWLSTEMNPEEEIFRSAHKFGSYVDILFSDEPSRFSFPEHEQLAKRLTQLLKRVPEIPAAAELLIRRCYYHRDEKIRQGFYITFYLFGYGNDEMQSRQRWAIGLKLVENAIRQLSVR